MVSGRFAAKQRKIEGEEGIVIWKQLRSRQSAPISLREGLKVRKTEFFNGLSPKLLMKAHEIFQAMKPETALSIFQYLRDEQREAYTASLASLAEKRKLRTVFVQRKPGPDQVAWMAKTAKLKSCDEVAGNILQIWLLKAQQKLLTAFLDGVGIEHDGEGSAEDIPDDLDAKKLESTAETLLREHDPEIVAIYLQTFQLQRSGGWDEIEALVEKNPKLRLGEEEKAGEDSEDPGEDSGSSEKVTGDSDEEE